MQRIKRRYALFGVLLGVLASGMANSAYGHDVQNSEIRAIFGEEDQVGRVEVWQTTSLDIAYGAARRHAGRPVTDSELRDADVLELIGQQLRIEAAAGRCELTKHAYRRVHHGMRLQMRFLFTCPDGDRPTHMTFDWMAHTPRSHFAVLQQNSGQSSPFKVIERGNPVVEFDHF